MNIYNFKAYDIDNKLIDFSIYKNKVLLIVNTASKCKYTTQLAQLNELTEKFDPESFAVLAFPSKQFGNQEFDLDQDIKEFCHLNYPNKFKLFKPVLVNGPSSDPIFEYLKAFAFGIFGTKSIKWNFTKFLVNKQGIPVKRFAPNENPLNLIANINLLINNKNIN